MDQNADWLGLKDRICVVTGAGSGIGRAVALAMASAGASLVLLDKDLAKCEATAGALQPTGTRAVAVTCDIADPATPAYCFPAPWRRFLSRTGTSCCRST